MLIQPATKWRLPADMVDFLLLPATMHATATGGKKMRRRPVMALALAILFTGPSFGRAAQAQDSESRIGAAAAVRGSVQLAALGPARAGANRVIGVNITSGTDFFLRDRIESGPDSGM
jgi:hypothetical protein